MIHDCSTLMWTVTPWRTSTRRPAVGIRCSFENKALPPPRGARVINGLAALGMQKREYSTPPSPVPRPPPTMRYPCSLQTQAEGRSSSTDWGSTAWSRPAPTYSTPPASGLGGRQSSGSSAASLARQPDHYDLPVRPNRPGGGGVGAGSSVGGGASRGVSAR